MLMEEPSTLKQRFVQGKTRVLSKTSTCHKITHIQYLRYILFQYRLLQYILYLPYEYLQSLPYLPYGPVRTYLTYNTYRIYHTCRTFCTGICTSRPCHTHIPTVPSLGTVYTAPTDLAVAILFSIHIVQISLAVST